MEIHRLKPMKQGYNEQMFLRLYKKTEALRNSLVFRLNPMYFGVTKDEIRSWFDDKFIHIFNKYCDVYEEPVVLGHLINGLKNFKNRLLINLKENPERTEFFVNRIELQDYFHNIIPDDSEPDNSDLLLELVWEFFQERLSEEEYMLFQILYNPPSYIAQQLGDLPKRIPTPLIVRYLGLDDSNEQVRRKINSMRKTIDDLVIQARVFFKENEISYI